MGDAVLAGQRALDRAAAALAPGPPCGAAAAVGCGAWIPPCPDAS
jgi:hypothetical protein